MHPLRMSVNVLNDNAGGLLRSRANGQAYAIWLTQVAEASNNSDTEAHAGQSLDSVLLKVIRAATSRQAGIM